MRKVSAPQREMYSSGTTTLPRDFDILAPSFTMWPWARNFLNGSSQWGVRRAQVYPGRVEEGVADVGLAPAALATHRTGHVVPLLVPRQRGHTGVVRLEVFDQRQGDRQI